MGARGSEDDFRFRVSDATPVPLRGYLLRLRVEEGRPRLEAMRPGSRIRLRSPEGDERDVQVLDYSVTGGRATQRRLDRLGELDILIDETDALRPGSAVGIGWWVVGRPAESRRRAA